MSTPEVCFHCHLLHLSKVKLFLFVHLCLFDRELLLYVDRQTDRSACGSTGWFILFQFWTLLLIRSLRWRGRERYSWSAHKMDYKPSKTLWPAAWYARRFSHLKSVKLEDLVRCLPSIGKSSWAKAEPSRISDKKTAQKIRCTTRWYFYSRHAHLEICQIGFWLTAEE